MKEYFIVQNHALGALSLYHFTKSYYDAKEKEGLPFPLALLVLPIIFNEKCYQSIGDVKRVTGRISMLNVLAEHRDIPVGLQRRVVEMSSQSFKSINLSFAQGLLVYDSEEKKLLPGRYLRIPSSNSNDNQKIFHAAKILGKWFAYNSIEQICIALNVNFNFNEL
jgi:hypothetical protein